jgi:predicted secreted protein
MLTTSQLSRARFVRRIGGGAVLLAGGAATGVAAPPASYASAAATVGVLVDVEQASAALGQFFGD